MEERLVKSYGKEFMGVSRLVEDYASIFENTGAVSEVVEKELLDLTDKCMFRPKKTARLIYLDGLTTPTPEQIEELKALKEEEKKARELFIAKDLREEIQALIGADHTLSRFNIDKVMVIGNKKKNVSFGYLPKPLSFFADPMNNANKDDYDFPSSVFRVQLREKQVELTGERVVILAFLSLCFDPYKDKYEVHHWRTYFKVVKKNANLSKYSDEDFLDEEDM